MNTAKHSSSETLVGSVVLARKVLSIGLTSALDGAVCKTYEYIESLKASQNTDAVTDSLPSTYKYLPHASSVNLRALEDKMLLQAVLREIGHGSGGEHIRKLLGCNQVLCDLELAWMRRQYALHLYPLKHAPHGWHQDGAFGFDFVGRSDALRDTEDLLPTVTCWIALTKCGMDAPGLEFVSQNVDTLLLPDELIHQAISRRFSADNFWKPQMEAGDAVIFRGGTLHQTHVTKEMQTNRTSVELRFVSKDNIPQRLADDCFVHLPQIG